MAKFYGSTCGELNRKSGTSCQGKGTKRIGRGEKQRYVCARHFKQWNVDRDRELAELKRDHQMGLHADNREAFIGTISDEYNISSCSDCVEERRAEQYGVNPDQGFKASMIDAKMKKDREMYEEALQSMATAAKEENGLYFLRHYADDVIQTEELDRLWHRVQSLVNEGYSESWSAPKTKLNIVDAYERVVAECKDNLISSRFDGEGSSSAFARAVGEELREANKMFIGRVNY
jgi:hypothetical protein